MGDTFHLISNAFAVGNVLANDGKNGPGPWTASLLSNPQGTLGTIRIDGNGTTWYMLDPWNANPFLTVYFNQPTVFYYKITNGLGEYDVGTVEILATAISNGQSASGFDSNVSSTQDAVWVMFDTVPYSTWIAPPQGGGGNYVVRQNSDVDKPEYWDGPTSGSTSLTLQGTLVSSVRNSGTLGIRAYSITQPVFATNFTSIEGLVHIEAVIASGSGLTIWTAVETGPIIVGGSLWQLHLGYYHDLYASGDIAKEIHALGGDANVYAYGSVQNDIEAKTGINVQAWSIKADLTSDSGDINAFSLTSFEGAGNTAGSISIMAGTTIASDGIFNAGEDVDLRWIFSINGPTINAGGNVIVSSLLSVNGVNVEGAKAVGISGLSGVSALTVTCDDNVLVYAGGNYQGTIDTSAGSIDVIATGTASGSFTGKEDVATTNGVVHGDFAFLRT